MLLKLLARWQEQRRIKAKEWEDGRAAREQKAADDHAWPCVCGDPHFQHRQIVACGPGCSACLVKGCGCHSYVKDPRAVPPFTYRSREG